MNINKQMRELVTQGYRPRRLSVPEQPAGGAPDSPYPSVQDRMNAALELVSQTAGAIKGAEEHAAETMARAEALANELLEKLQAIEARLQSAEAAQRRAENEAADLADALDKARKELEQTQRRLFASQSELTAVQERANLAERRASEAEVAIERIVEAVQSQLSVAPRDTHTQQGQTDLVAKLADR